MDFLPVILTAHTWRFTVSSVMATPASDKNGENKKHRSPNHDCQCFPMKVTMIGTRDQERERDQTGRGTITKGGSPRFKNLFEEGHKGWEARDSQRGRRPEKGIGFHPVQNFDSWIPPSPLCDCCAKLIEFVPLMAWQKEGKKL